MTVALHHNQQRLAASMNSMVQANAMIDDQIAILSRLCISKLNTLTRVCNEAPGAAERVSSITKDSVKQLFDEFHALQKRSDFKELNNAWLMGEDMSNLPPEPVKEEQPAESAPQAATADHPEGAEIFGGDYGKATDGNTAVEEKPSTDDGARKADEVPSVPSSDAAAG